MSTTYRSDIDGLRAIAILSVVIYHTFPTLLPGGFVGVDIFFVISGFLITGLIASDLTDGSFSIREFYSRRIKRILPILSLVLFSTFLFGWFVLYSDEYQTLGKHIASAASFTSNFVYLGETGYFDVDATAKPLLHLWSLAIEEQFYFLWPIMLVIYSRRFGTNTKNFAFFMLIVSVSSFTYCIYLTTSTPNTAYYLPFSRFWELSLGGLAVFVSRRCRLSGNSSRYLTLAGLGLLLCSFLFINKNMRFPGYVALLPCLGATAILLSNKEVEVNRYFLGNRTLVFFGLTSYSFYLWHWPVLFFVRNLISKPSNTVLLASLVFSFLLAVIGYFLIERPTRLSKSRYAPFTLLSILAVVGYLGLNAYQRNGLDFREVNGRMALVKLFQATSHPNAIAADSISSLSFALSESDKVQLPTLIGKLRSDTETLRRIKEDSEVVNNTDLFCSESNKSGDNCTANLKFIEKGDKLVIQVVGDSHASNFFQSLKIAYPDIIFIPFIEGGCVPISKRYTKKDSLCGSTIFGAMSYVTSNRVDLTILSSRWVGSFEEVQADIEHYKKYARKVAIVGPSLTFRKDVYKIISDFPALTPFDEYVLDHFDSENIPLNDSMRRFSIANGVSYIDKISLYCINNNCPLFKNEKLLIFDKGHLTSTGVSYLANSIRTEDPISIIMKSTGGVLIRSHPTR